MQFLYAFGISIILMLFMYFFVRKDITKDNTLTKRGFYKLIGCLVAMFVGIIVLVVLMSKKL
ncbi:DUF3976 domain-containing protein [Bacillus pseudomycoides]|uniref:DUF3976 domain-containing protein n=1 Tax=Bacillus pseudomycoides TaxID=64104 RepID=A0ABD6TH36_9BACI|nr:MULTISPECIES: DUF3976 domain-containing protein [Bacillus]KFN13098.1 hypothetical protein DJ94_1669 [Bacillus pseudomycoides]MBJ8028820.1 DUF3976 domain-containing protein [Bacillus cereus group sp. N21]MCR8856085.1 DUF3976 domain-containing protein [Bacillus pseudomycoides]MCX2828589.1 DUF3976 domain-containing protein [Bacillus sp. DHT2]MDR4186300.1 DUF3976 domain-containing protein [Bacillus pseudomycoides]